MLQWLSDLWSRITGKSQNFEQLQQKVDEFVASRLQNAMAREQSAQRQIEQAQAIQKNAEEFMIAHRARAYTTLKSFPTGDVDYLRALVAVIESPEFLYFMHLQKMAVVAKMEDGGDEVAHYCAGMLRGFDSIMRSLHAARQQYSELAAGNAL